MTIFIERFLLALCAGGFLACVVVNVLKLSAHQRLGLGVALFGLAYFLAATITHPVKPSAPTTSVQPTQTSKSETPPKQSPPETKAHRPIEISLNYYQDTLPIKVPAGSNGHVFWLGETYTKRFEVVDLYLIPNISGVDTKLWPDMTVIEEAKKKSDPGVYGIMRFDIANHGQDNLEVKLPFEVTYLPDSGSNRSYRNAVIINPLDHGRTYTFYVMNNCPVRANIRVPKFAQAKVVGEQGPRQFQLELENPQHPAEYITFEGTKTNWIGGCCE